MAVRQYIGARYVTKIYENSLDPSSAEWEATVNYEPLTLVTYNNGSYLSKKEVPGSVGDPASNPSYWVQTGFYNGQIASLQAQIGVLSNLDTTDKSSLVNAVNEVNKIAIRADQTIPNRKMVFVGDSFASSMGVNSWLNTVIRVLNLNAANYAAIHAPGYGFSPAGKQWITLCSDPDNGFPAVSMDHDSVTDVYVVGGANDVGITHSTLDTDINNFITYTKTIFPNATVHIAFVAWTQNANNHASYTLACRYYYQACMSYGAKWVTNIETSLHKVSMIQADEVHPTAAGGLEIGFNMCQAILNGDNCSVHFFDTQQLSWDASIVTHDVAPVFRTILDNQSVHVSVNTSWFVYPGNMTAGTPVAIGTLTNSNLIPYDSFNVYMPITGYNESGGVKTIYTGSLHYDGQTIYFTPDQDIASGATHIPNISIMLPTFPEVLAE